MKTAAMIQNLRSLLRTGLLACLTGCAVLGSSQADASIAYGSINNFDTVNDTGHECHGFEIELEDCHSTDVTYTYNYNHYGAPNITEDNSVSGHPKCVIRWESKKNADGSWAAYTAIPAGPISPTNGHMFTNPSINFGGEHFGVGYRVQPTAVKYNWLIDNGSGVLVHGGAVQVSTPTFTYYPAVAAPAQVQAVIAPPPPPVPEPKEFGKAVWVKEIRTTTHNNQEVKLRELVSDDPDNPNDKNWRNGEPDEVETEWQMLQKDYGKADGGANNAVPAAPEALPGGDEVVTRRYEFFKYIGPVDNETGEAMAQSVAADGIHGVGTKTINGVVVDLSTIEVVGEFTGSQMAAVDVDAPVGLIDHVGEGRVNKPFAARTVVVEGALPFTCTQEGALPAGMTFDTVTGVLSGTPASSGQFNFKVVASDNVNPDVAKSYTLNIAAAGAALAPASLLDTTTSPVGAGTTTGDGSYAVGANATVTATPSPGYAFVNWTDNGVIVSNSSSYTLALDVNHSLVANFASTFSVITSATPAEGGSTTGDGSYNDGDTVTVTATASQGYVFSNWTENDLVVSNQPSFDFVIASDRDLVAHFVQGAAYAITTSSAPLAGGTTSGGGVFANGTSVTVTATPAAGYAFVNWTDAGTQVSASAAYTFTVSSARTLTANFTLLGNTLRTIGTSSSPTLSGITSGAGTYVDGTSITVTAAANPGFKFSKWKQGGSNVSSSSSYTFTVTADRNLVATFTEAYSITASAFPANGGTTEMDSSSCKPGDTATATATPASQFTFVNWTEDGTEVSTSAIYSFPATRSRVLVANFQPVGGVVIGTSSSPAAGGNTSGGGGYMLGQNVTVTAQANAGYTFAHWTDAGGVVSNSASYSFTATGNRSLIASFITGYTIGSGVAPALAGTTSGGGSVPQGTSTTLIATATPGYTFLNWTNGAGTVVSTSASYTFTPVESDSFTANFQAPVLGVHFDFDSGAPALALHQLLPLSQTVGGITATFSSPNAVPPEVSSAASTGYTLGTFSGRYLAPSVTAGTVVEIAFDQPVTGIELDFATLDAAGVVVPSDLQITAFDTTGAAPASVGTAIAHGDNLAGDTLPTGKLTLNSALPFDSVRIELPGLPDGAQRFLIDNVVVSPGGSTGGSMLLANPNWNITLTDFGYSDFLLDNTPGFEGREYLSGEWGSAVAYQRNGNTVKPRWFEPNFMFPDWKTNSDFHVVQGIHLIGTNLDGLPIAESVIANGDLEITLRFEMLDTVVGTPMGITPASSGSAPKAINSNRYVLSQTFAIKNISGSAISNLQLFQLLHGFTSQHGLYDNHAYPGKLSTYQYDATLAGVDGGSAGDLSSTSGLEDHIGFHSKIAPSAFEIGYYGIDGSGVDDHVMGKPSDGVHLSIEDNWENAPYLGRKNRDYFAPASRWVAGGQRWDLGTLNAGQTASFDIVLSLLTGTTVTISGGGGDKKPGGGGCNGGSSHVGGLDFEFEDVDSEGTFFGDYAEADDNEMTEREDDGQFVLPTFETPGGTVTQVWNLDYTGTHTGLIHLTFHYNPDLLPAGFDQTKLTIRHFTNGAWEELVGNVDTVNHTIKVSTASLSPFALATATPGLIPALTAARPSPGMLNLSWPADQAGWVLQESTDLITWVDSTRAVTTSGGAKSVTINGTGGCCFFRLAHP